MRGIATPEFNLNSTSPTGVFYDEVYLGTQWLGGPQIFDLERIEVLRGPQGTLYGKNTTGGTVNLITRAPSFKPGGYLNVEVGTNEFFHVTGAAETVLVEDKLAARLAVNMTQSDGWVKNRSQLSNSRDLSSIDNHAVRLALKYQGEDWDATLRLLTSRSSPTNIGIIASGTAPGGVEGNGVNPRVSPYNGQPFDNHEGAYDHVGEINANGDGVYLTITKSLGGFELTSISSYFEGDFKNTVDVDGSIADFFWIDFFANQNEMSQDLRIATDNQGGFNFIAGVYYQGDLVDIHTLYQSRGAPLFDQDYKQQRWSYAAYIDGTLDFTSAFQAYGGIRWTSDHGRLRNYRVVSSLPPFIAPGIPIQPTLTYDDEEPTGRLGLRYKLNPDLMLYAQYARGYRSSAFNGGALAQPADLNVGAPEFLDSFEAGVKSQWFDDRLRLNVSAFRYDFENQQFRNTVNIGGGAFASVLINAPTSQIQGLEAEMFLEVTPDFTVSAGLGLLDTEFKDLQLQEAAGSPPEDLSGNKLVEAPPYTLNLAADYTLPLANDTELAFHVDAVNVGEQYFTAFNRDESKTDEFWEANARIVFRDPSKNYEIAIWGKNLNDNEEPTGIIVNGAPNFIRFTTVPYPRRFGVELNYRF